MMIEAFKVAAAFVAASGLMVVPATPVVAQDVKIVTSNWKSSNGDACQQAVQLANGTIHNNETQKLSISRCECEDRMYKAYYEKAEKPEYKCTVRVEIEKL